jgi:crossover junction endodeoxyribonuclease RuvC
MNNERDLYLGVDPGMSGGIALLHETGAIVHVQAMPETERDTAELLEEFASRVRFALIEKVTPMPKQGLGSTWTFGQHYGFLRGLLVVLRIPFDQVRPQVWQSELGCRTGGDKNVSKAKAQQLWPAQKITHAIADALLLAEHCRRKSAMRQIA